MTQIPGNDDWSICDRCSAEILLDEANDAPESRPDWAGATLCNDCYALLNSEAVAPAE